MSESGPRVLPASLHRPGEWKGEGFCGGRGYDQVPEGTVIVTTKNIVVKAIYSDTCVVHLATGCRWTQLPTDGKGSSYQGTGGCRRAL